MQTYSMRIIVRLTLLLAALLGGGNAHASCGSALCSFNSNWNELGQTMSGWMFDLRYSYSMADTLRSGSSKIVANPTDPALAGVEVENRRTINQLVTATLDYNHDEHWGVSMQLPYVMRNHSHSIGDPNPALVGYESFDAKAIGDIRLIGRYHWLPATFSDTTLGVKFGVKLPTGRRDFVIQQTGALPGEVTLQPGNGSTDLIVGAYWNRVEPGSAWNWFAQGSYEHSVHHLATFKPGDKVNVDLGTRYDIGHGFGALLQLNGLWLAEDKGPSAALTVGGVPSSGGSYYSLTPGLTYAATPASQLYAVVQLPFYQHVNGEQLTAGYALSGGMRLRF